MMRLLAINIDGTLLKSNGRLQSATIEAINFVQKKDVVITLLTKRNFLSARKVAKALKINAPIIAFQGAIVGTSLEAKMRDASLDTEKTFNIIQVLENLQCNIRLFHERYSLGNRKRIRRKLFQKTVIESSDPFIYPTQFVDSIGGILRDDPIPAAKIDAYFADEYELQRAKLLIEQSFKNVEVKKHPHHRLEIVNVSATKLEGLHCLTKHLDIEMKECVVIGDDYDDIPAIEAAGLGVAMENSPKEVKFAADWVTRSNNQLGVAYMIKEYFRKQQRVAFLRNVNVLKR